MIPPNSTSGILSELRFEHDATKRGMVCCRAPASCIFDYVVVTGRGAFRVQVKSAHLYRPKKGNGRYVYMMGSRGYSKKTVDIVALYKIDEDAFLFFSAETTSARRGVTLIPEAARTRAPNRSSNLKYLRDWTIFDSVTPSNTAKKSRRR